MPSYSIIIMPRQLCKDTGSMKERRRCMQQDYFQILRVKYSQSIENCKSKARYTLFANNDEKGTKGQNQCEQRIMYRVIRHFRRSGRFFDEIKELFSSYLCFYNTFMKIGVYEEQCVDTFSSLLAKLNFFCEKVVSSLFANGDEQCVGCLKVGLYMRYSQSNE